LRRRGTSSERSGRREAALRTDFSKRLMGLEPTAFCMAMVPQWFPDVIRELPDERAFR
jgi:hypothetical protein